MRRKNRLYLNKNRMFVIKSANFEKVVKSRKKYRITFNVNQLVLKAQRFEAAYQFGYVQISCVFQFE